MDIEFYTDDGDAVKRMNVYRQTVVAIPSACIAFWKNRKKIVLIIDKKFNKSIINSV